MLLLLFVKAIFALLAGVGVTELPPPSSCVAAPGAGPVIMDGPIENPNPHHTQWFVDEFGNIKQHC